ncbi:MAG: polysaccharide deacetylase family protein [Defluviitaleaceae bacterium]|nr:polysaccharide deacetylase family protein [Defluviitaleaceae bacterium]
MKIIKKFMYMQAVCVVLLVFVFGIQASASSVIRWGLRYDKSGEVPVGNATAEYLKAFNSYYHGTNNEAEKTLFLTFDAGYENGHTAKILDTLKENNVPGAFFLVGSYLKHNPELVKRMVDEGHTIGNHSMSHGNMTKKTAEGFTSELKKFEEVYESVIGSLAPKYYRPPEGVFDEANLVTANEQGYKTILWSVTYVDWDTKKQPSREYAFEKLMPRLHPGAILMLHSTSSTNADILHDLIAECHKLGYTFKSLDDL